VKLEVVAGLVVKLEVVGGLVVKLEVVITTITGEPESELSGTVTRYTVLFVLNLLTSTPNLSSQASDSTSRL